MKRLLAILLIATSLSGCGYNDFQRLDEDTKAKKEKEVEATVVLPRRACSLPSSESSAKRRNMAEPERCKHCPRLKAVGQV